jgi:hypothetical protein
VQHFITLAERLDAIGYSPVFMFGPVEREQSERGGQPDLAELRAALPPCTLADAAALLAAADLYVGNDSGISSRRCGRLPVVAVFGPTDRAVWRPLGPHVRTVIADFSRLYHATLKQCSAMGYLDRVPATIVFIIAARSTRTRGRASSDVSHRRRLSGTRRRHLTMCRDSQPVDQRPGPPGPLVHRVTRRLDRDIFAIDRSA